MKAWGFAGASVLLLASVSACSDHPALADRGEPLVKAEEARLAGLLGADRSILGEPGVCTVRLLGQQAGASFVWAHCAAPGPQGAAASLPVRIDGSKVTIPEDGEGFADSVRQMFPTDLAEFVLEKGGSPELSG